MRLTVTGVFKSIHQAERALSEIETSGYANNQISVVVKKEFTGLRPDPEFAAEINTPRAVGQLHDLDSFLVQADNIDLPEIGLVTAGGPLAGALVQGDKSLAESLTYYGVNGEAAARMVNLVADGYVLAVVETNSTKASEVANLMNGYGAHRVEKWNRKLDKPLLPHF